MSNDESVLRATLLPILKSVIERLEIQRCDSYCIKFYLFHS